MSRYAGCTGAFPPDTNSPRIVATKQPWYSRIIGVLSNVPVKNLTIRRVADGLMSAAPDSLPVEIPLRDISV